MNRSTSGPCSMLATMRWLARGGTLEVELRVCLLQAGFDYYPQAANPTSSSESAHSGKRAPA